MPLITITETGRTTDTPNATVSVDRGMPHPLTITSPFSDADDARLRWYFEEHLRFPFTQQVRASPRGRRDVGYRTILSPPDRRAAPGAGAGAGRSGAAGDVPSAGRTLTTQRAGTRRRRLPPGALRPARSRPDVSCLGPGGWGEPPYVPRPTDGQPLKALYVQIFAQMPETVAKNEGTVSRSVIQKTVE